METVGASPMDYLMRWRMLRAGDRLVNSGDSISLIARALGYESESAFSTAFKRVIAAHRGSTLADAILQRYRPARQARTRLGPLTTIIGVSRGRA